MEMDFIKRKLTLYDLIKTYFYKRNANKWILQKVKNDDATYCVIKNRLKDLKYNFLENFGSIAGQYSPEEHRIEIFGKDNITQTTVLHETLHACSNNDNRFSLINKNDTTLGLMGRYNNFITDGIINCFVEINYGEAINEAATEFFTYDILNLQNKKYNSESKYTPILNLFANFCKKEKNGKLYLDEEIKQKLFNYYINSKYYSFVEYLSNIFNSPKSQVQMLMFQLDKVIELEKDNLGLSFDILIRCYNTLYEMKYNRFIAKNKTATLNDFLNSAEVKDMTNLIPNKRSLEANKIAISMFKKKFENYKQCNKETNNLHNFVMNYCFNKKTNQFNIRANSYTDTITLSSADIFNKDYRTSIKEFDDYEKLSSLLFFASPRYIKKQNNDIVNENAILHDIIVKGKPENENYKNDFMFYILNLPRLKNEYFYYLFSPDELLDYIKCDKTRYKINKNNILKTEQLKTYLKISNRHSEIFDNDEQNLEKIK